MYQSEKLGLHSTCGRIIIIIQPSNKISPNKSSKKLLGIYELALYPINDWINKIIQLFNMLVLLRHKNSRSRRD